MPCFTCDVAAAHASTPGGIIHLDPLIMVNHHQTVPGEDRAGWLVISPRRHVTRIHHLTGPETGALFAMAHRVDDALTAIYGATRTLVASLGWGVTDHVHIHCVPTFHPDLTSSPPLRTGIPTPLARRVGGWRCSCETETPKPPVSPGWVVLVVLVFGA